MSNRRDLEHITARALFVAWWHAIQSAARKLGAEASAAVHHPLGHHRQTMDAERHLPGTSLALVVQLERDGRDPMDYARCAEPGCGGWRAQVLLRDTRRVYVEHPRRYEGEWRTECTEIGHAVGFCTQCTTREQIRALDAEEAPDEL